MSDAMEKWTDALLLADELRCQIAALVDEGVRVPFHLVKRFAEVEEALASSMRAVRAAYSHMETA